MIFHVNFTKKSIFRKFEFLIGLREARISLLLQGLASFSSFLKTQNSGKYTSFKNPHSSRLQPSQLLQKSSTRLRESSSKISRDFRLRESSFCKQETNTFSLCIIFLKIGWIHGNPHRQLPVHLAPHSANQSLISLIVPKIKFII